MTGSHRYETRLFFPQSWPWSRRPSSGPLICSLDLTNNRGTKLIWTKRRHALGSGPQPRCRGAKIAPTVPQPPPPYFPFVLFCAVLHQLGPKWESQAGVCVCVSQKVKHKGTGWRHLHRLLWQENKPLNFLVQMLLNYFLQESKTMHNIFFWRPHTNFLNWAFSI